MLDALGEDKDSSSLHMVKTIIYKTPGEQRPISFAPIQV